MRQLQRVAVLRGLFQDVALGSDVAGERHHQVFANGVDGGIRNLREKLLEVMKQRLRPVGQAGERCISAHRAHWLLARGRHWREQQTQVFFRVAEGPLPRYEGLGIEAIDARRLRQSVERDLVLL